MLPHIEQVMTLIQTNPDKLCFGIAEIKQYLADIETIVMVDDGDSNLDASKTIIVSKTNKYYSQLKSIGTIGVLYYSIASSENDENN